MLWIDANHKKEDAASVSMMIGQPCRPPRLTMIEFRVVEQDNRGSSEIL
jgi:hypothetical protein